MNSFFLEGSRASFSRNAIVATTAVLSGCLATTDIEGNKTDLFQPAFRANFNINGNPRPAAEIRSGHTVEIGHQQIGFSSEQPLATGQSPVILNGVSFTGPDQLKNRFDFAYTDILWRIRQFNGNRLGWEILTGLAQADIGIDITSSMQHASQYMASAGPQLGLGIIWRTNPQGSVHMNVRYYVSQSEGVKNIEKYELAYRHVLRQNISLHAGYAEWYLKGGQSGISRFNLHFSGPQLVLECSFNAGGD